MQKYLPYEQRVLDKDTKVEQLAPKTESVSVGNFQEASLGKNSKPDSVFREIWRLCERMVLRDRSCRDMVRV